MCCTVSMIMDHYREKWEPLVPTWPNFVPYTPPTMPMDPKELARQLEQLAKPKEPAITDAEILEFRKLLERAREYDRRNGEPDCELDEKRQAILDIAKQLGVEISFL